MADPGAIPHGDPLAYFLTWPTYGTWLPGDERGWVRRGRGWQLPDPARALEAAARMAEGACRLNAEERRLVEVTIAEHCRVRNWTLHAASCRSNHLHVVVTSQERPEKVRDQLKAWCTRRLKVLRSAHGQDESPIHPQLRERWWAERGSNRYINDFDSLEAAILYVREAQDSPR